MPNRIATTTHTTSIQQGDFSGTWSDVTSTTTLQSDAVPLSTVVNLVGPGDNTIPIPAKAAGVRIESTAGANNPKTLKSVAGDGGLPIDPVFTTSWRFPQTSMVNFVLHSQVNETVTLVWL